MSADNTVIVFCTKGKNGFGAEYRVAHVQCVENMTAEADYPSKDNPLFNRAWLLDIFKSVRVFTDPAAALDEANRIEKSVWYVEYGIRFICELNIFFPATDQKRRQRRFVRHTLQMPQAYFHHFPSRTA